MAVEIKEIVDQASLTAYLKERPQEVSKAVALRAALQIFPLLENGFMQPKIDADFAEELIFTSFRATHVSWVASIWSAHKAVAVAVADAATAADAVAMEAGAAAYVISATDVFDAIYAAFAAADSSSNAGASSAAVAAKDAASYGGWLDLQDFLTEFTEASSSPWMLWPNDMPEKLMKNWQNMHVLLMAEDSNWAYWINWYEARLRGEPATDEALHIRVAQIEEAEWEQGAAHVNKIIAGFVEEDKAAKTKTKPKNIQDALDSAVLRASLADFEYYDLDKLMKMIPFPDDLRDLEDEQLKKDIAELLDLLRQKSAQFLDEVASKQVDAGFRQDLQDYVAEVSRPLADMRPRFLHFTGGDLHGSSLDDFITDALGERLSMRLERLVDQHYDLMRLYFAAALGRLGALDQVEIVAGASPADVTRAIRGSLDALWAEEGNPLPQLDLADQAVLESRFEELQLLGQSLAHPDEKVAARRSGTYRKKAAALAVTIVRLALKSGQVAWKVTKEGAAVTAATTASAAAVHSIFPAETLAAINALMKVLSNIPWPL